MAIIYTYPKKSAAVRQDLVVISDSQELKMTKQITVDGLLAPVQQDLKAFDQRIDALEKAKIGDLAELEKEAKEATQRSIKTEQEVEQFDERIKVNEEDIINLKESNERLSAEVNELKALVESLSFHFIS